MEFKQSLARRILIAFVLMTALVGGTFAVGIIEVVHVIEEQLISRDLNNELTRVLTQNIAQGRTPSLDSDTRFYSSDGHGPYALPEDLAGLKLGFHEVFEGENSYHALVREIDGRRYVMLQDQSDFEAREQVLYRVVMVGFGISVVLALLLGWLLARKVIEPVVRLAGQVRHRDQLLGMAPPLAPDYASDEVGQLAQAFDDTLGRLHDVLNRERLFTSDVSHELRTPLMVLATSCELLAENPSLDARGRTQVERIARATEEMRDLVQTFLMLARSQRDEASVAPQASLSSVADDLASQWRGAIEYKGLRFEYQPGQPQERCYNASFLRSVLGNLLRNALHYTDSGSIRLVLKDDGFVVEDSGVGIPEEDREAMFRPFVRGPARRGDGLGLGLSLVQRICDNQGWTVSLSASQPTGCRFEVDLKGNANPSS
ncbi:HAMP domain-containing histidine kinase [Pseudomonas sp. JM0905a]|uniref:histidine kinase n=1 Tax=Metapseudomonas resinovorans TaxID=53412 RepID=A0ABT4Y116_METRE|nr:MULTISPECIES: HAMP domain-containing sensor histidine kinase [Pseudomonas]MBD2838018.1 HAMP domain-containing histidine kinase [Pseudomonas sp. JM0905a]MDA8482488.1 HAMP domain-containing histidine kinase [Pseudomonas resinovorans]